MNTTQRRKKPGSTFIQISFDLRFHSTSFNDFVFAQRSGGQETTEGAVLKIHGADIFRDAFPRAREGTPSSAFTGDDMGRKRSFAVIRFRNPRFQDCFQGVVGGARPGLAARINQGDLKLVTPRGWLLDPVNLRRRRKWGGRFLRKGRKPLRRLLE